MARELESLVVKFNGDASGLVRGARRARRAVRSFAKDAFKATATIGRFGKRVGLGVAGIGGVGAVGAAAGLLALGNSARNTIDDIRKLATNLGVTASEAQQLAFVADLTGTSLETVSIATQQVTRSVGDARQGMAAPIRAFDMLGLKLADLEKMSALTRFRTVIEALGDVEKDTDRAAAAAALLGRGWRQMAALIAAPEDAFGRADKLFRRLGFGLKETDSSTEKFNDNITELATGLRSLLLKAFEDVAPQLLWLSKGMLKIATAFLKAHGGARGLARTIGDKLWAGFLIVREQAMKLPEVLRAVGSWMTWAGRVAAGLVSWVRLLADTFGNDFLRALIWTLEKLQRLPDFLRQVETGIRPVLTVVKTLVGWFVKLGEILVEIGKKAAFVGEFLRLAGTGNFGAALAFDRQAAQSPTFGGPGADAGATQEKQLTELDRQTDLLQDLRDVLIGGADMRTVFQ